jgi:hypothetical protein
MIQTASASDPDRLDYETTVESIRQLTDIRFKLLAFVPTLSGAAIALVTKRVLPGVEAAVGALGFLITLGIAFYDQRNSSIYDDLVGRAAWLERNQLGFGIRPGRPGGGPFNDRGGERRRLFGVIEIWHDRALALIYATVLGGWAFPVCVGAGMRLRWAAVIAVVVAAGLTLELQRLGGEGPLARRWWTRHWHARRDRRAAWRRYHDARLTKLKSDLDKESARLDKMTEALTARKDLQDTRGDPPANAEGEASPAPRS